MRRARRARRGSGGSGARSGSGARGGRGTRSARGGRPRLKQVGGKRLPARSSSARDAKRDAEMVRLNKFLADNGVASRRRSDELILGGKVLVDGDIVTELGTKIDPRTQEVDVDGVILKSDPRERRYYILHKPAGVVCTSEIRETKPRAIDLITDPKKGRIFTVGRLDEESKGLLLLTSDGEFAERIAHPRFGVPKTYLVRIPGQITDDAVQKIREGVYLAEGRTAGARVIVKRRTAKGSTLEVTIQEGRNREVRRIFVRVGYKVTSLTRTQIGPLGIRGLREGKWRALSREEVEALLAEHESLEAGGAPEGLPRTPVRRSSGGAGFDRGSGGGSGGGSRRGSSGGSTRGGGSARGARSSRGARGSGGSARGSRRRGGRRRR